MCAGGFVVTKHMKNLRQEFRREIEMEPPAASSVRKWYETFLGTG